MSTTVFDAQPLHEAIAAVAPIIGVSVGNPADKSTWLIDFKPEATNNQRQAAATVITNFNATPRRMIAKSVVISRLTDQQLDAALALLNNRQKERWRSPDHPSIYADDPEIIGLIQAIGADPAIVLAE